MHPLSERHGWTVEEVCSYWNWAPGSGFLNNSEFSLTWQLARNPLPFSAWTSEWAWKTCLIALAAAMAWKKRLSTPSANARRFARSGITSGRRRLASNPNSSCCLTLVTSWTMFCLRFWGVSGDPSWSQNYDLDDAKEGIAWRCKLLSLWFDIVF